MAAKSKKKTGRKQTKKKKTEQSFLGEEIFVWVTLAVSILLLISNFGFGGNIGACAGFYDPYLYTFRPDP